MDRRSAIIRTLFNLTSSALSGVAGHRPGPGDRAPGFDILSTRGRVRLIESIGRERVLLFISLSCRTRAGARELGALSLAWPRIRGLDTRLLAVTPDPLAIQREFANGASIDFPLLPDERREISSLYGGEPGAWIIGVDGRIVCVQRGRPAISRLLDALESSGGSCLS